MNEEDSLDLRDSVPQALPTPDRPEETKDLDTVQRDDVKNTDHLRNTAVNFAQSVPLRLLRLTLGPSFMVLVIVVMVFPEQVNVLWTSLAMMGASIIILSPPIIAAQLQRTASENDFGQNLRGTEHLSLNSFPGAERIISMIKANLWNEWIRMIATIAVGALVMIQQYFEPGGLGNIVIMMAAVLLTALTIAQTIRLERTIQMRSLEFKYLPFHAPTQHSSQLHTVLSDLIEAHMDPDSASQWSAWLDELKPSIRNKLPPALARERIVQAVYLSTMTDKDGIGNWKLNNILTSIVRREMRDWIMAEPSPNHISQEDHEMVSKLPFNIASLRRLLEHTEAWQPGLFKIIRRVRNDILTGDNSLVASEWRMDHDLPLVCPDGQGDLFLMIHNFGEREETVEVEVVVPGGLPVVQTFRVTPQPTPKLPAAIPLDSSSMTETLADRLSILMERGLVLWIGLAWSPKDSGRHPVQIHLRKPDGETISSIVLSTDVQQRSGGAGSTQVRMRRASSLGIEALRDVRDSLKMR